MALGINPDTGAKGSRFRAGTNPTGGARGSGLGGGLKPEGGASGLGLGAGIKPGGGVNGSGLALGTDSVDELTGSGLGAEPQATVGVVSDLVTIQGGEDVLSGASCFVSSAGFGLPSLSLASFPALDRARCSLVLPRPIRLVSPIEISSS